MSWSKSFIRAERHLSGFEDVGLSVFLAALLILSFAVFPFVDLGGLSGHLVSLGFTALFLAGSLIGGLERHWRRAVFALAFTGAVLGWMPVASSRGPWLALYLVVSVVFNLVISTALLRQVFRPGEITWHRFRGAIAVYVLIGFLFALVFVLLESIVPGSFAGMDKESLDHQLRDSVYFSFVTLTTVGYGDITPVCEAARNLAVVEALLGQVFLAILIGRLVTLSGPSRL